MRTLAIATKWKREMEGVRKIEDIRSRMNIFKSPKGRDRLLWAAEAINMLEDRSLVLKFREAVETISLEVVDAYKLKEVVEAIDELKVFYKLLKAVEGQKALHHAVRALVCLAEEPEGCHIEATKSAIASMAYLRNQNKGGEYDRYLASLINWFLSGMQESFSL